MRTSRRDFLKAGAAGGAALVLGIPLDGCARKNGSPSRLAPNQWLRIGDDGRTTLVVARSEMGQGVRTALAMILAEELEADWSKISIEQASPGPDYEDMNTGGSASILISWLPLRKAGAAAREMLVEAAARKWGVGREACRARSGFVVHETDGRRLSYGELVALAATLPVPKDPPLKDRKDFRIVGTPVRRIDGPAIVSGEARYGLDARVPGMLFGAVARCPVRGGRLVRFDASRARKVPGVVGVFEVSTGLALVAQDSWAALSGRDALVVEWDEGPNAKLTTAELWRRLDEASSRPGHVQRREGDAEKAIGEAPVRLAATYRDGFQAHASVEPMNSIARVGPGECEIWSPTQNPQRVQREAAELLGIPPGRVRVHVTLIGGGFGRRLGADYATEAVEVARAAGRPVQVLWSRADDFAFDRVHPGARVDVAAGLDASGRILAWTHRTVSFHLTMFGPFQENPDTEGDEDPWGGYDNPFEIPHIKVQWLDLESPVHTGAWRSVFYPPNVFARECFLDEIAGKTGRDPLALRLELLGGKPILELGERRIDRAGLRAVLQLAAEKAGWGAPLPERPGRRSGRGIACNVYHGRTLIAQVADVSVGPGGDVRVHRVVTATDCGQPVNPLGVTGQVESGIAWGLSLCLKGEITYRDGRVEQTSFRDFPVLGYGEMPEVEVYFVESDKPPSGFGEQPVPAVAPAVANAIFAATGRRLYRLPIRPEDVVS
jgi:isoquinoline 1-oxidoreductase beta subunit